MTDVKKTQATDRAGVGNDQAELETKAGMMWQALVHRMNKADETKREIGHGLILECAKSRGDVPIYDPRPNELRSAALLRGLKVIDLQRAVGALRDFHRVLDRAEISTRSMANDAQADRPTQPVQRRDSESPRRDDGRRDGQTQSRPNGHAHHNTDRPPASDGNGQRRKSPRYRPNAEVVLGSDDGDGRPSKPPDLDDVLDPMRRWRYGAGDNSTIQ